MPRCLQFLILSLAFLSAAYAGDPAGTVTVESNLARKQEPRQQDRIWSGVILATNPSTPPKPIPPELREYEARLKHMFGYSQFEIVGSSTEVIDEENGRWLVPSQRYSLNIKARRAVSKEARGGYLLNLELFQEKRLLVVMLAKVAPGSPLFFRGPECGKGQIIIVLQVLH